MSRLVVLFLCLASAGAIAGYSHYAGSIGEPTVVYTVPARPPEPAPKPAAVAPTIIESGDHAALARALQRELKRVGCYSGEITGVWTTSSRMAMKAFTERVNATLPIDKPDLVLLSLVQGHPDRACGIACPAGQSATDGGACVPDAVLAKAKADGDLPPDKENAALPAAGAAAALAATAAAPRPDAKAADRPPAVKPPSREALAIEKKAPGDRVAPQGGPVPPEGLRERKPRRSDNTATVRPPKVVRDVLRALGIQ